MTLSLATLRLRFPQVASVTVYPDDFLQILLDEAGSQIIVGNCQWGSLADAAQGYLAMHLLAMAPPGSGVGPGVSSVSAGQASISYWAISVVNSDSLLLTPYGREYVRLRKLQGPTMRLVDDGCTC